VEPRERLAAIINLLLDNPGGQTVIFARTRADVADLAEALAEAGFTIAMLSGEMEQAERNRALASFKRGNVDALVATDVAARGIDVQDVSRVIHAEPPTDADAYTHRSGRTGRAGRKGTSSVIVTMSELSRTLGLLGRARVRHRFAPIPTADAIREARDEKLLARLTADPASGETLEPRSLGIAERIVASTEPARAVARLVAIALQHGQAEPREVTPVAPPTGQRGTRAPYERGGERQRGERAEGRRQDGPRQDGPPQDGWTAFRVSWGQAHGAEPRRLVAMMCRRGKIEGRDIGAIRVGRTSSVIEVANSVAADFERATHKPDPRDPRVHVRRWLDESEQRERKPSPRDRRVYDRAAEDAAAEALPKERPSRAVAKDRPSVPKDRPSVPKDRPSVPKDRASVPKDRPSVPKDGASVPKARPSVPKDRPSVPKDRASVPKDRPSSISTSKERAATTPKERPAVPRERPKGSSHDRSASSKPGREQRGAPKERQASGGAPNAPAETSRKDKPWRGPPRPQVSKSGPHRGPPWRGGSAPPKRRPPR
jgi:ATP-dependent RNA helicase DeaD